MFKDEGRAGKLVAQPLFGALAMLLTVLYLLIFAPNAHAAADTCTWTGAGSDSFTSSGNWNGCDNGNLPESGDTLVFPQSASNKTIDVDGNMPVRFINITGTGYVFDRISFDEITIDGPSSGITSTQDATFNVPVNMGVTGANVINWAADDKNVTFNVTITLDATGDVSVGSAGRGGSFRFDAEVVGSAGQFVATNLATITLTGAGNTYTAGTVGAEADGYFECISISCFGNNANHIYMGGGEAVIRVAGSFANPIETSATTPDSSSLNLAEDMTLSGGVAVHDSLNVILAAGVQATMSGNIVIDDNALVQVLGAGGYTDNTLNFSGTVSGDGGFAFEEVHATLGGNNTYTGETIVSSFGDGAVLSVASDAGLGSASGITTVEDGATLNFSRSVDQSVSEPITVAGAGVGGAYDGALYNDGQYVALFGVITLSGNTTVINNAPELMVLVGKITGTGNLTYTGDNGNGIYSASTVANDYSGTTSVVGTRLFLNGADNITQIPHDITITGIASQTTQLVLEDDNEQIADDATITMNSDAADTTLIVNDTTETVGGIEGDGFVYLVTSTSRLNIGGGNKSSTFEGQIQGATGSQIYKVGTGTWDMKGVNDNSLAIGYPNYYVNEGKMLANFADASGQFSSFNIDGGVLGGSGIVGPISVLSGNVAPGNSPGCLNSAGALNFSAGSTLTIELNDTTACTAYDRITASGAVNLGSATLSLSPGFIPSAGTVFTIVEGASVSGTFAGLSDGATLTAGNLQFRINYLPGSVTLTALSVLPATTRGGILANTGFNANLLMIFAVVSVASGLAFVRASLHRRPTKYLSVE